MHELGCHFSHYCHAKLNNGLLRHCLLPTLLHGWSQDGITGKLADFRFRMQHFALSHVESASVIAAGAVAAHITSRNAAVSLHMPTIPLYLFHLRQLGHSLFPSSYSCVPSHLQCHWGQELIS